MILFSCRLPGMSFGRDPGFIRRKNLAPGQRIAGATIHLKTSGEFLLVTTLVPEEKLSLRGAKRRGNLEGIDPVEIASSACGLLAMTSE